MVDTSAVTIDAKLILATVFMVAPALAAFRNGEIVARAAHDEEARRASLSADPPPGRF
jgi:hypothetical protein